MTGLIGTLSVDRDRMRSAATDGYTTATAVADHLVRRGVAFRVAHHVVGAIVAAAESAGVDLIDVDDETIRTALASSEDASSTALASEPTIGEEIRAAAEVDAALASADVTGGTAPQRVTRALEVAKERLANR
jgi:argininosuccinate lyase